MEVSLEAYRAAIGLFNYFRIRCFKFVYCLNCADTALILLPITLCIVLRIVLSNDVELNPGPFFKFGHLNARSLNRDDKFDEISELVKENGFDVFAVTETWLNDRVSSDCLQIPGYNPIIRLDRRQRMGGGVAFFTTNSLVIKRRLDLELAAVEFLWIAEFRIKVVRNSFMARANWFLISQIRHQVDPRHEEQNIRLLWLNNRVL